MPQFRLKTVPIIEALVLGNGDYLMVKDGAPVTVPKAEFESLYEAVPQQG